MRIIPTDLQTEPLTLAVTLAPGGAEYAADLRQVGPVVVTGRADLLEEHRGPKDVVEDIRVRARVVGDFEGACARCLEPIPHHVDLSFDLIFRPAEADAEQGERSISEAETEIGYYETSGLLLDDVVREQVLLSLPDRSLCQDDCKGLCPHCGTNLNEKACGCGEQRTDPRWAALQGLGAVGSSSK